MIFPISEKFPEEMHLSEVLFVDNIPMNSIGKIYRLKLKEIYDTTTRKF